MAMRKPDPQAIEVEVAELGGLDLAALRQRWEALFGNPPPKSLRHAFLVKACAYGIQVKAYGGLSLATRKRLRQIAEAARTKSALPVSGSSRRIKAGTRLVRAWRGTTHTVTVHADGGFEWNGARYRSLSAIATKITGTNWNGHAFFGLKKKAPGRAVSPPTTTTAVATSSRSQPEPHHG